MQHKIFVPRRKVMQHQLHANIPPPKYASGDPFLCTSQTNGPGYFCSWLQNDGNFVIYWYPGDGTRQPAFASATDRHDCPTGANNCQLIFQGDGNLVIYINGQAKWASNTVGDIGDILYFSASNPPLAIMHNNGDGNIDWPIVPHAVADPPDYPHDYTSHEISGVSVVMIWNDFRLCGGCIAKTGRRCCGACKNGIE
ncbi:hypothetical protein F5B18DRAFT_657266 [Nemania serpens]|nr:hypothetical protein F5B18DRAFT_657266 [Nemania serpens]